MAVADVDALVAKGTPIDDHARRNTTSVYTSAKVFPRLPERLCTDLGVRTLTPPVEGKLVGEMPELDVGAQVRVRLVSTDVERGFIDFVPVD